VQPRRMRSQQVCAASLSVTVQAVRLRNAWWSLEWSPREKEPPAVEIGGGNCRRAPLPSSPPRLPPLAPAPSTLRLGPNVRWHPSVPPFPSLGLPTYLTAAAAGRVGSCSIDAPSSRPILLRILYVREEETNKKLNREFT